MDVGHEETAANDATLKTWFLPQAIIRFAASPKMAIAIRSEYFSDPNGLVISQALPEEFKSHRYLS